MSNNLNINGMGTVPTGNYGQITINGMGKLNGDIRTEGITISGTSKGEGNLETADLVVNGQMKYAGQFYAKKMSVNGMATIDGNADIKSLFVAGRMKFGKNSSFGDVDINGSLVVDGDFEGNRFFNSGKTTIKGLLSADNIEFKLNFASKVKEIGGENIVVKKDNNIITKYENDKTKALISKFFREVRLEVDVIEGDSIVLEYTTAKKVSGNNIVIGEGCVIDEVNCSGELIVHEKSNVKKRNHIGVLKLNLGKEN